MKDKSIESTLRAVATELAQAVEDRLAEVSSTPPQENQTATAAEGDINTEEDLELKNIRERKYQELLNRRKAIQQNYNRGGGSYREVEEKDFFKYTTTGLCICHFYSQNFSRCRYLDEKLELLAPKYPEIFVFKINAEKASFLVSKLFINVLPTLILLKDGIVIDKSIGFEKFGNSDEFTLKQLERYISKIALPRNNECYSSDSDS